MKKFWDSMSGYKTYIGLAIGAITVIAHKLGVPLPPGVQVDDQAYLSDLYQIALAAFIRHGISTGA